MAPRDPNVVLLEIAEACDDIADFIAPLDADTFEAIPESDRKTYRAIKNAVAEIGEGIKALPADIRSRNGSVDWRGLAGLRDLVAHQYFRLDMQRLWPVLLDELPAVLEVVRRELDGDPVDGS